MQTQNNFHKVLIYNEFLWNATAKYSQYGYNYLVFPLYLDAECKKILQ